MIRIITILQTKKPSSLTEEVVVLLKGQEKEILGGISVDIHTTDAYISRFWLKPQIRGYSFGSILLHEAFKQLQVYPVTALRMGTHIQYIKHILLNNQFSIYDEFHHNNIHYSFFQKSIRDVKIMTFTHPYELIPHPSVTDQQIFHSLYQNGAINIYGVLKPHYYRFEEDTENIGSLTAYYGKELLAIDQIKTDITENKLMKIIKQYAQSLNIHHLHYINGCTNLLLDERDVNFNQSLQFV